MGLYEEMMKHEGTIKRVVATIEGSGNDKTLELDIQNLNAVDMVMVLKKLSDAVADNSKGLITKEMLASIILKEM